MPDEYYGNTVSGFLNGAWAVGWRPYTGSQLKIPAPRKHFLEDDEHHTTSVVPIQKCPTICKRLCGGISQKIPTRDINRSKTAAPGLHLLSTPLILSAFHFSFKKLSTALLNLSGLSTGGWWLAPLMTTLRAPGISAASVSATFFRLCASSPPMITSVGALIWPSRSMVGCAGYFRNPGAKVGSALKFSSIICRSRA